MAPRLSVIVPVFNEADNIPPLVQRILKALTAEPGGMELLIVDDCSTDDTWLRIQAEARQDPRVRPIRHSINRGQSAALWTGFLASEGAVLATLDGDLQNDPADLPSMLAQLATCDMVCGVRVKRADTFVRRGSARVARVARKIVLRMDFADSGCNLRVFKRKVLHTLAAFDGVHRFMPILAQAGGAVVREVPVSHHPRVAGKSKYGIRNRLGRGIRDLIMIGLFIRRQIKVLVPATNTPIKAISDAAVPPAR